MASSVLNVVFGAAVVVATLAFAAAPLIVPLLVPGFTALRDTVTPLVFAALALLVNLLIGLALMGPLGLAGLALGMSLSTIAEFAGLYCVLQARLHGLHGPELLRSAGRSAAAAAVMGLALAALRWLVSWIAASSQVHSALLTVAGVTLGGAVFLATSWLLGGPEVRLLAQRLRPRRRWLRKAA